MALAAGLEPATHWLTANCSTTELRQNASLLYEKPSSKSRFILVLD